MVRPAAGRQRRVTSALGLIATTLYDQLNRPVAMIDALGNRTSFAFDAAGRQRRVQNALGKISTSIYDASNRRVVVMETRQPGPSDSTVSASAAWRRLGRKTLLWICCIICYLAVAPFVWVAIRTPLRKALGVRIGVEATASVMTYLPGVWMLPALMAGILLASLLRTHWVRCAGCSRELQRDLRVLFGRPDLMDAGKCPHCGKPLEYSFGAKQKTK